MKILENPFYVLGATPRDNRQKIQDLVDEKTLELDSNVCAEARLTLTNPRKRLSAELAWFPGISVRQINTIVKELKDGTLSPETMDKLSPLAGFNALAGYLALAPNLSPKVIENYVFAMAQNYDVINPDRIIKVLNEDRSVSGFPEITDTALIRDELLALKDEAVQQLQNILTSMSFAHLNKLMLNLMERALKSDMPLMLLDDVIDKIYVMAVQKDLDKIEGKITSSIKFIKSAVSKKCPPKASLEKILDQFLLDLEEFDNIMQPIQLSTQRRGLEHDVSRKIAQEATSLSVDLIKCSDDLKLSEKVLKKINELFVEVDSVNQETANILGMIEKKRQQDKEWEKSINYSYTKKSFWGNTTTLSLNAKEITFDNQSCKTSDVKAIRYGTTKRYVNGVYKGTDTFVSIDYGGNYNIVIDNWLDVSEFDKFTECLWKAVGPRIIMAMVDQLVLGNSIYGFIYNDKVKLAKKHTFAPSEEKFFKWKDVKVIAMMGTCVISAPDGYMASFNIKDTDNGVPLVILLTRFKELGGNYISETFNISKEDAKQRKKESLDFSDPLDLSDYGFIWNWVWVIIGIIIFLAICFAQ